MKKLSLLTAVLATVVCFFAFLPSAQATFTLVTQQALGVAPGDVPSGEMSCFPNYNNDGYPDLQVDDDASSFILCAT